MITNRDPETWHDQRPSHSVRPSWLIEAQDGMDDANKAFDEAIDCGLVAGALLYEKLVALRKAALAAEAWYRDCCNFWQQGIVPPSVLAAMKAEYPDHTPISALEMREE